MLELPGVTLVCIDCLEHELALAAIEQTLQRCGFADTLFVTDRALFIPQLRVVEVPVITSQAAYSRFVAKDLVRHVATPHALLIRWDAFVVNSAAWSQAFLEYDYIAPLPVGDEQSGTGIALTSRRLLEALGDPRVEDIANLDHAIRTAYRPLLERDFAIRYPGPALSEQFAFGDGYPVGQPFGFQGLFNMWMYFQPQDLNAFLAMASPAILAAPDSVALAINLRDLGRVDEARAVWRAILAAPRSLLPEGEGSVARGSVSVLQHLARAAFERKDLDGAQRLYRRILERLPEDPVAIGFLGVIATGRRQYDVAHDLLLRALTIAPDAPEGFNNLGLFEHSRADFAAAVAAYRRALELAPDYSAAHNNLGLALQEQGEVGAAIESFRAAVRAFPDFADAHWNLALALLLAGELEEGFAEQEWRMRVAQHREWWARRQQFPQWQGEPLAGKRILILAEQGMGDMIQFVRYATPLAAQGATVMVEAAPELADLLRTVPGVREVVSPDPPFPRCDVQIPMLSLPLRCGTRLGTIPAPLRYLGVDPVRRARWQQLLGPPVKPRIGIAWAGNPEHVRDRYRSLAVAHFASLLAMPEYEWLGLQKGPAAGQIAALPPECVIRDLGKDSLTFADLAALIELLDLVITVDTAIVHVAGALGKSALLLLDTAHDWRWPRGGSEARWYPSVQIVRQPSRGDWAGAMLLAAEAMQRLCPVAAPANAIKARPQ